MAQDVEAQQDKPSNACCAKLQKKHSKLLERCAKLEQIKNKFRDCTLAMQQRCDVVERDRESLRRDNESLREASEKLKVQVNLWNSEKDIEAGRCADLEVQLLKRNSGSASHRGDEQLRERIAQAEEEIKLLKGKAASEKKRTELEKKKADEALKKLESVERKKAEEYKLLWEKLEKENDDMKPMLALEKSKSEDAHKKLEAEKQKTIGQSKRAKLAVDKSKEQINLAETNLKKAMYEKARADDLSRKLEEAMNTADKSSPSRNAVPATDIRTEMLKNDTHFHKWMEKMLLEKEHDIVREKKRADSAKKKAKKQIKVAEECRKMSMEQKDRADQLSGQLEMYKLRLEGLQKEMQVFVSSRIYAGTSPMINNDAIHEIDTVELLKKQLKLEKMLAKHAKEVAKIEALRNTMLQQELCHIKQESVQFQQHLNILLDKSFLHGPEGIDQLKKIGSETTKREVLGSDGSRRRVMSGKRHILYYDIS